MLFITFLAGFIVGTITTAGFVLHVGARSLKKKKDSLNKTQSDIDKILSASRSVEERMDRVRDITEEQLSLVAVVEGPQKNSLDGKFKNSIVSQMKALDEEKSAILRSILADGHDPELSAMDSSGVVQNMKLSEFMVYMGITMDPVPSKATKSKAEQIGKFTVIRGGKGDSGNTTH